MKELIGKIQLLPSDLPRTTAINKVDIFDESNIAS